MTLVKLITSENSGETHNSTTFSLFFDHTHRLHPVRSEDSWAYSIYAPRQTHLAIPYAVSWLCTAWSHAAGMTHRKFKNNQWFLHIWETEQKLKRRYRDWNGLFPLRDLHLIIYFFEHETRLPSTLTNWKLIYQPCGTQFWKQFERRINRTSLIGHLLLTRQ